MRGQHLEQVILVREACESRGARAQSVEIYEDGVIVRWVYPDVPGWAFDDDHDPEHPDFELSDDRGTQYVRVETMVGGQAAYRGEDHYVPRVPDGVKELVLHGSGAAVRLALRAEDPRT